jgi:ion channel
LGFALIGRGLGSPWSMGNGRHPGFLDDLYVSGTTLFTLGLGDIVPASAIARVLIVAEAGTGLGFLTVGVAYLPVIYQSFSRRELQISLLDGWAGSPPSAIELFHRLASNDALIDLQTFLHDWERWTADVLESHISYPQLAYFRSQHGRQSWVSALTTILDVSALILAGIDGLPIWGARQTFAIARHAAIDLCQVLNVKPIASPRLASADSDRILAALEKEGLHVTQGDDARERLVRLRKMYEPYVAGLSAALGMDLPPWIREGVYRDNWETTPKTDVELHL